MLANTIDLVISACLDFRECFILGLYSLKFANNQFRCNVIIKLIPRDFYIRELHLAKIKTSRILSDLQYSEQVANCLRNSRRVVDEDDLEVGGKWKQILPLLIQFHKHFCSKTPRF